MSFKNMSNSEIIEYVSKYKKKRRRIGLSMIGTIILIAIIYCVLFIENQNKTFPIVIFGFILFSFVIIEMISTFNKDNSYEYYHNHIDVTKYKKQRTVEEIKDILKNKGYSQSQINEISLNELSEKQLNDYYLKIKE
ncbi:MAG: hypothetical protein E7J02_12205 [Staphylococcus warneri]|nr:hypothetical protein [Staphylococcus warneri]